MVVVASNEGLPGSVISITCIPLLSATKAVVPSGDSATPQAIPDVSMEEVRDGTESNEEIP